MSRVDFYILPKNSQQERFACLMTNKVWRSGHVLFIHVPTREAAEAFDNLLWTYSDISFVPHDMADQDMSSICPVTIGWQNEVPDNPEALINLTPHIHTNADRFARIIEIVAGDDAERQMSRNKYRDYRELGHELHNHKINPDYGHP